VVSRLFGLTDTVTTDDWYTPAWIFDGLGITFDLDVAAPIGGLPWVPAIQSYSESDDGLGLPWFGLVWCNPPYSAPTAWCRKWATHPAGCILVRADLSTSGPHAAYTAADCIYFPERRLQFVNGQGGKTGAVNFSSVLLGRGQQVVDAFHRLERLYGGAARALTRGGTP
jgi:hypothetical protein